MSMLGYKFQLIGRQRFIDQFFSLRTIRAQKNVFYIEADGGLGKTRLLEEFVARCQDLPRPWHVAPEGVLPLIDFYSIQNRTVNGLRRNIALRLGMEYFEQFNRLDAALQEMQNLPPAEQEPGKFASLRKEVEFWFFRELKRALRKAGQYSALFFDTFEAAFNRRVGRWFLETFLTNPATFGCIIVFAGRPCPFEPPYNALHDRLEPFTREETQEYFLKKFKEIDAPWHESIYQRSQGNPLLVDLIVHGASWGAAGTIGEFLESPPEDFEKKLVYRYTDINHPATGSLNEMIVALSILKHRFNRSIYERFWGQEAELSYHDAETQLKKLPFVKYRPGEHALALHDIFQEMIAKNADRNWSDLKNEILPAIVHQWYPAQIENSSPDPEKYLLQTEQLAYLMEYEPEKGRAQYAHIFEEIKARKQYELNDMLWGEAAVHFGDGQDAFQATLEQANWLFENGRHEDAGFWFERLLDDRFSLVRTGETQIIARLGHCYLRTGLVDKAASLWEDALESSKERGDLHAQAVYAYNLAHVRADQGRWEQALDLYEQAARLAHQVANLHILGQAYFVMARLRGRKGNLSHAKRDLQRGLSITERQSPNTITHAQALVFAGDVHRYLDDPLTAISYYRKAGRILEQLPQEWPKWKTEVFAGIGAAHTLSSRTKRVDGEDLEGALEELKQAFEQMREGLILAREKEMSSLLPVIFDRMGEVFLELNDLEALAQGTDYAGSVNKFSREAEKMLDLPEEQIWRFLLRQPELRFEALDTLGQAQRLFEIAVYQADEQNDFHQMFDSLIQAAQAAQLRGREEDLNYFGTLAATLRGLDAPQQEALFLGFIRFLEAHLIFPNAPETALSIYQDAAIQVMKGGSFGEYLMQRQLPLLQRNLLKLEKEEAQKYCDILKDSWKEYEVLENFIFEFELLLLTIS